MTILFRSLCLLAVVLLTSVTLIAQEEDDVVRVNTDLVVMNVTVTDRNGQYVRALKKNDFRIFEDGKEVPANAITSFAFQDAPYAAVVLLDSSGSMEMRFTLARSAAI